MACTPIVANGAVIGFMCGSFSQDELRFDNCSECGSNYPTGAEYLCDYPVGNEKTCDMALCRQCARVVGRDMHYCPTHYQAWQEFESSGDGKRQVLKAIADGKKLAVLKGGVRVEHFGSQVEK